MGILQLGGFILGGSLIIMIIIIMILMISMVLILVFLLLLLLLFLLLLLLLLLFLFLFLIISNPPMGHAQGRGLLTSREGRVAHHGVASHAGGRHP